MLPRNGWRRRALSRRARWSKWFSLMARSSAGASARSSWCIRRGPSHASPVGEVLHAGKKTEPATRPAGGSRAPEKACAENRESCFAHAGSAPRTKKPGPLNQTRLYFWVDLGRLPQPYAETGCDNGNSLHYKSTWYTLRQVETLLTGFESRLPLPMPEFYRVAMSRLAPGGSVWCNRIPKRSTLSDVPHKGGVPALTVRDSGSLSIPWGRCWERDISGGRKLGLMGRFSSSEVRDVRARLK